MTATERLKRDGMHLVLRGTLQRNSHLAYSIEYDGSYRPDYRSHTAMIKMRYEF